MTEAKPTWMLEAELDIGQHENLGLNDSSWIRAMLKRLGATWLLGQPWCGGAMAKWMTSRGINPPSAWYRAKAWATWGEPLKGPRLGCVVVFERQGGGHVGLVTGITKGGLLLVLGGNQGDAVRVSAFNPARVIAYRWPPVLQRPGSVQLPVGTAPQSNRED